MKIQVMASAFKRIVCAVEYAADTGAHHREGYNAIHLRVNDGRLDATATDGFRIACETLEMSRASDVPTFGIEAKMLRKAANACARGRAHEMVDLEIISGNLVDELRMMVSGEEHRLPIITRFDLYTKLIDGNSCNFTAPTCVIDPVSAIAAIGKRDKDAWLRIVATPRTNAAPGWMSIREKRTSTSVTAATSVYYETIMEIAPITFFELPDATFADVNARWFLDALKATKGRDECFLGIDNRRGVRITTNDDALHQIVPMQNK